MFLCDDQCLPMGELRAAITRAYCQDESTCVKDILAFFSFDQSMQQETYACAKQMAQSAREEELNKDGVAGLMYQYDLTTEEGVLLMCMAEALLRVPDAKTEDLLISDKLSGANWQKYQGISHSSFVNSATWGLALSDKVLTGLSESSVLQRTWSSIVKKIGEPMIRKAVRSAIKMMSKEFVLGRDIKEAISRGASFVKEGYSFSFDMLGEAALTQQDADMFFERYVHCIDAVGKSIDQSRPSSENAAVSIKLSALYPRYSIEQYNAAFSALTHKLLQLARRAKTLGVCLTVDAEEANRLDISLDIFEAVFCHADLAGWDGFGLAVQAYQKRARYVLDWLIALGRAQHKRIPVRLVKGAYWDTEIKQAQMAGHEGYPVFTRKATTDLNYMACAQTMLQATDVIYAQFATHNAYTIASILSLAESGSVDRSAFEFQNLQGMGKSLHKQLLDQKIHCRIYAPVGSHEELLPYLVRRLLENGANSSFVNQLIKRDVDIESLVQNPMDILSRYPDVANPKIPLPQDIFQPLRLNSLGADVANPAELSSLDAAMQPFVSTQWTARPAQSDEVAQTQAVMSPAKATDQVGEVVYATAQAVNSAFTSAQQAFNQWQTLPVSERADMLDRLADLLMAHRAELLMLLIREAGKTIPDAIDEVREAIDFCRYYALQAREVMQPKHLKGYTGETNTLLLVGRGVMACISPWNFPVAIFVGQVVAALVTGNCVLAKPAEQTSLCAAKVVELCHLAGVPQDVLQLLPGEGRVVGHALVSHPHVAGVLFTGSTATAQNIARALAERNGPIVPFIAETGGLNAMIADSTALPEHLVDDVIVSAFGSAGQRCSALRVLFIQDEIADRVLTMLKGAMALLRVDDPGALATDIGPVIDPAALSMLQAHADKMAENAQLLAQVSLSNDLNGHYFAPRVYELSDLSQLTQEVFGPILHVIRYRSDDLDEVIDSVNALEYGLTFGVHTRITSKAEYIAQRMQAGNVYVNRNMIGAMVGVQPFGGRGLSGTGPKAGGPHYLLRLCTEKTITIDTTASGGNAELMTLSDE